MEGVRRLCARREGKRRRLTGAGRPRRRQRAALSLARSSASRCIDWQRIDRIGIRRPAADYNLIRRLPKGFDPAVAGQRHMDRDWDISDKGAEAQGEDGSFWQGPDGSGQEDRGRHLFGHGIIIAIV